MNKTISICTLIATVVVVITCAIGAPGILSDQNSFLKRFVGVDLLNVLGVILAITVAASGQLHLEFNKIEERFKERGLTKTRQSVRSDTFLLIWLFLAAICVVVVKPLVGASTLWAESLFNGAALLILIWNVLLLVSFTRVTFAIPPHLDS